MFIVTEYAALIAVKEQLDTVVELRQCDRFFLQRFEGCDSDIRFWTRFYSYGALMSFYSCMFDCIGTAI